MCGIAGAFRLDGGDRALPEPVLRAMTAVIDHRGPDDAGYVAGDGCSMGARRLSVIDVAGGHQPLADETGRVWAVQNGEIYNHATLRRELEARGHAFKGRCDRRCSRTSTRSMGRSLRNAYGACSRSRSGTATHAAAC
jgi:asparagine synthase (glutamine-hydrolysing)